MGKRPFSFHGKSLSKVKIIPKIYEGLSSNVKARLAALCRKECIKGQLICIGDIFKKINVIRFRLKIAIETYRFSRFENNVLLNFNQIK